MPRKHSVKQFLENGCYHIYNRGVEKRNIFQDDQDFKTFLYFLKKYLTPPDPRSTPLKGFNPQDRLYEEIKLIAYCLMPNHFHLLVQQITSNAITKLLRRVATNYAMFFNQKYQREGSLFQGIYKAVLITTDDLLLHISRYIHLNPLVGKLTKSLEKYPWSSYPNYADPANSGQLPIAKNEVLAHFSSPKSYEEFVRDQVDYARELDKIKHLIID